ncbi:ATP synthase F1 subunit gamma [Helicobacter cetorum]|uniref:ATP synthase gamma chain n=1 Tax=Helicobacter cetorum (strain ATCC BAA-540 / CCUG 52418 / MIT 99-5656) TaxID=1163745 RepID=I0EU42_HELCM|nr:ATP synthase F1 subunit gamma [Helicobacter cetorum]AFI06461.1 F0F1 ATP synthase subunit gamma [Helicobacter cetorum MIT 99-5656]
MANLRDIRKKIGSVKNMQKITHAMKLVSTSKLRKAEEVARRSRAFALKLDAVFNDILSKMRSQGLENIQSKYFRELERLEVKKVDIIFITADKGLCGGFNTSTIKKVLACANEYKEQGIKVRLRGIGKKGNEYFSFNGIEVLDKLNDLSSMPNYERSQDFMQKVVKDYLNGETDKVVIIHNGFKNMISQELRVKVVLPVGHEIIHHDKTTHPNQESQHNDPQEIITSEPSNNEDEILDSLAKKFVEYSLYYALIDSLAAEHSARMRAMDTATNNAKDLVKNLTISYNKARQEAITTELVEINAGVEALK